MNLQYRGHFQGDSLIYTGTNGLRVILSGPKEREEIGWHFSVSCESRYPTWEEQRDVRYALIPDDIYMVMILPPKSQYVNIHENCFHWHEAWPKFFDVKTGKPLP